MTSRFQSNDQSQNPTEEETPPRSRTDELHYNEYADRVTYWPSKPFEVDGIVYDYRLHDIEHGIQFYTVKPDGTEVYYVSDAFRRDLSSEFELDEEEWLKYGQIVNKLISNPAIFKSVSV